MSLLSSLLGPREWKSYRPKLTVDIKDQVGRLLDLLYTLVIFLWKIFVLTVIDGDETYQLEKPWGIFVEIHDRVCLFYV